MDQFTPLNHLIAEARRLANDGPCAAGHQWESVGGRRCPNDWTEDCSQAVYQCPRCGEYDYGERGGPGADDCEGCTRGDRCD